MVVKVGILGCGNVGSALVSLLQEQGEEIAKRSGFRLVPFRIAVRQLDKDRGVNLSKESFTTDPYSVVTDEEVDIVVELIGGIDPARDLIREALNLGKPVVTANKELIATYGAELMQTAGKAGVDLLYEAAVGGAIPLVRILKESLAGERIRRVVGIVNGTTNYILTRMSEEGIDYDEALLQAIAQGMAEADPRADVEGYDAAAKAAILSSIAFGVNVVAKEVYREGITGVRAIDISFARNLGYEVKLLAIAELVPPLSAANHAINPPEVFTEERVSQEEVAVRVHPAMLHRSHPLASVRGPFNAVFIEGATAGEIMLYGRGAGGRPTASAVLGDLIDAAHNRQSGAVTRRVPTRVARVRDIGSLYCKYYLNVDVVDRPGVLAAVAGVFGENNVSIRSMEQLGLGDEARLVFLTHTAKEADMIATVKALSELSVVEKVGALLRVLDPIDSSDPQGEPSYSDDTWTVPGSPRVHSGGTA